MLNVPEQQERQASASQSNIIKGKSCTLKNSPPKEADSKRPQSNGADPVKNVSCVRAFRPLALDRPILAFLPFEFRWSHYQKSTSNSSPLSATRSDDVGMYFTPIDMNVHTSLARSAFLFLKSGDHPEWSAEDERKLHVYIMKCIDYAHCIKGYLVLSSTGLWSPRPRIFHQRHIIKR